MIRFPSQLEIKNVLSRLTSTAKDKEKTKCGFDDETGEDYSPAVDFISSDRLRSVTKQAGALLLGFAAGAAALPFQAYPAGIAAICSAGSTLWWTVAGTLLSLFVVNTGRPVLLVLYVACAVIRFIEQKRIESGAKENRTLPYLLSSAAAMTAGTVRLIMDGMSLSGGAGLAVTLVGALLLTYFLSGERDRGAEARGAAFFIAVFAACTFEAGGFNVGIIIAGVTVFVVSRAGGAKTGAIYGLMGGLACSSPELVAALSLCGIASGLLFRVSDILAVSSSFLCAAGYLAYTAGFSSLEKYLPNMLAWCLIYVPVWYIYSRIREEKTVESETVATPYMPGGGIIATSLPTKRIDELSQAFDSLSDIFYDLSDKLKHPSGAEVRILAQTVMENMCVGCSLRHECIGIERVCCPQTADECSTLLTEKGRIYEDEIPESIACACAKSIQMSEQINLAYNSRLANIGKTERTPLFAKWYGLVSKILSAVSEDGKDDIAFESELSEKLYLSLADKGIKVENVVVMGKRQRIIYLFGADKAARCCPADELRETVRQICGGNINAPEFIPENSGLTVKLCAQPKYNVYSAHCSLARPEEDGTPGINGDTVAFFTSDSNYHYSLISDGMGSGRRAALASRLVSLIMEKLLYAGGKKDLTLELLNTLLMSREDECFATVDLCEIDLYTGKGEFIKAGAAPAFVIRQGTIFKIQSATVPVGIINNMNAEQTSVSYQDGDTVIMLSDGVVQSYDEGGWLLELLGRDGTGRNAEELAELIVREARTVNRRRDDISAAVMYVREIK